MKAVSAILVLGALVCSAAARPNPQGQRGANRGGNQGGRGGKFTPSPASAVAASSSAAATASASTSADGAASTSTDLQTSLKLDASVLCSAFADDGQSPPVAGQSASLTSTNNWINFCALTLPGTPLTNGNQITSGSCNPNPIGLIPSVDKMPSAKFLFPKNGANITANQAFNAQLNVRNFKTGFFTNAQKTYFSAPQQLDSSGLIIGHTHIVIEALTSIDQDVPNDPKKFIFFKGVDNPDVNGVATAAVTAGVPAGAYRVCSINTSENHVPVFGPVAQHGSFDDCSYFTAI